MNIRTMVKRGLTVTATIKLAKQFGIPLNDAHEVLKHLMAAWKDEDSILVGNTFPITLIRHKVIIVPITIEELREKLATSDIHSFWGHSNTLAIASRLVEADLTPRDGERLAIRLSEKKLPMLNDKVFKEVYLLNPDYKGTYRPKIGEEVDVSRIAGWTALRITFEEETE